MMDSSHIEFRFAPKNACITFLKVSNVIAHDRTVIQLISEICEVCGVTDRDFEVTTAPFTTNNT